MPNIRIEPLSRQHRSLLKDFRNQEPSLVTYLQRFALRHGEQDLLARTYVTIHQNDNREQLAGYFSLTTVSVERSSLASIPHLDKLPKFPIPGVLLARLAVDERAQGQGLGRFLFEEALGLTLQLCHDGPVRFRLFVTDAIDENAALFYERFDLQRLDQDFPLRMVLDLKNLLQT